jgi:uncharacterized membrane protein
VLWVILEFLYVEYKVLIQKQSPKSLKNKHHMRQHLGSYLLLGLEFMIAADVIHTVLDPTMDSLIILGAIVAIRTVISYFLNLELKQTE